MCVCVCELRKACGKSAILFPSCRYFFFFFIWALFTLGPRKLYWIIMMMMIKSIKMIIINILWLLVEWGKRFSNNRDQFYITKYSGTGVNTNRPPNNRHSILAITIFRYINYKALPVDTGCWLNLSSKLYL